MLLLNEKNVHFIGIGGSGMLGLAKMLYARGYNISGSDTANSLELDKFSSEGAKIYIGHNPANIPNETQIVVKTVAVKDDNPEIQAAKIREIPIVKYAEMVGKVMSSKTGIAVAGTHGKTTTTSIIAYTLKELGKKPDFIIGGNVPQLGGNFGVGQNGLFVVEACEYDRSFHNYYPEYAIINNIEEDHLDYYKDIDEIVDSFKIFALQVAEHGAIFYSKGSQNIQKFINEVKCRKISYSITETADYYAKNIKFEGRNSFYTLVTPDGNEYESEISLTGTHNLIDALAAFSLLHTMGFEAEEIIEAMRYFRGVKRRMEFIYENSDITLINDYAHHPTEIKTVLRSLKTSFKGRRIITVFQPHQHSRTRFLLKDFSNSFFESDYTILPDIFFVRDSEEVKKSVHSCDLVDEINANNGKAVYIPSFQEIEQFIIDHVRPGDIIITMGAGDIYKIAYALKKRFMNIESKHFLTAALI